jgi:DNA-binding response OmpR family regulator
MRFPHLIFVDSEGELVRLLGDLVSEQRWLVRLPRTYDSALSFVQERRPGVLFVRIDPGDERADAFHLIGDAHHACADVPVVAVSAAKLPDTDRVAWTGVLLDLGARYVLFPPLTRSVLEDMTMGLVASSRRRLVGDDQLPPPAPRPMPEPVIDLANEDIDA